MKRHEVHRMDTELIADRQTMRYHCRSCQRCVEDGPEGLRVLFRGDVEARHRGGSFNLENEDISTMPGSNPLLH